MGYSLALNMKQKGHDVVAFDVNKVAMDRIQKDGIKTVPSVHALAESLSGRKVIWMMVPAGQVVDVILNNLKYYLKADDIVIDGGNSFYKDSIQRAKDLEKAGVFLLDCGTSGSVEEARTGVCTMVGGWKGAWDYTASFFKSISVENGSVYCGKNGSGHFMKMIHNGIEYGMMQAIAEGFELIHKHSPDMDLANIARVWNNGSLVRGKLLQLTQQALESNHNLETIRGVVHSSGEGKWTVETALEMGIPAPVITMSLLMRYRSQQEDTFSGKMVAALRKEFGGHEVEKKD